MAKAVKKRRRLKRSVRKTFGALFMASALAVAAIPTEGLQAAQEGNTGESIVIGGEEKGKGIFAADMVPYVDPEATIYTYPLEGTGVTFWFAYVNRTTGTENSENRVAVILGYEQIGDLTGGTLTIPDTMEAYKRYSYSSSDSGNVAVNMDGDFLYYKRDEYVLDSRGQRIRVRATATTDSAHRDEGGYLLDDNGNPVYETEPVYTPCYYKDRSTWVNDKMFYVRVGGPTVSGDTNVYTYKESDAENRIASATVAYIGSQYIVEDGTGNWRIQGPVTQADQGVFYHQTNISTLIVGKDVMGIGNYAFAQCGFQSITFGNGLRCLGDSVFEGCTSLSQVNFDYICGLSTIGAYAFSRCTALQTIDLPAHVQQLGDSAFEGCTALKQVTMIHTGYPGELEALGQTVFMNCSALESIEFPITYTGLYTGAQRDGYSGQLDVSEFQGCRNLAFIKVNNSDLKLVEGDYTSFGFKEFLELVPETFYLEGPQEAAMHDLATEKEIAYKFYHEQLRKDIYEKAVSDDEGNKAIYWVDTDGKIVRCVLPDAMQNVLLPETLGPQKIIGIDSGTFQDKCFLKNITIPASVTYIAADAFKGSHRLQNVIFTNAENVQEIGQGAFNTQATGTHISGCTGLDDDDLYLNFVGTIGRGIEPFDYAMNPGEYINTGSQYRTYITYYSGWPTNLAVRRNETTRMNELIGYPTFGDLSTYATSGKYLYMEIMPDYARAAAEAASKYLSGAAVTDYEQTIIDATLHIELPDGIDSIAYVDANGDPVPDALVLDEETGLYVINEKYISTVSSGDGESVSSVKGLFSYNEAKTTESTTSDNDRMLRNSHLQKDVTAYSLQFIGPEAFKDCKTLTSVSLDGPLKSIGDYAFWGCENLYSASVSESTSEMGLRPFAGCTSLSNVEFNGSENFSCDAGLIFKLGSDGKTLVEFLYARDPDVLADELAGVTAIYPEAFMGTSVYNVDLTQSSITNVPSNAFRETVELNEVKLPNTCRSITKDAFTDSHIRRLHIPGSVSFVDYDAFRNIKDGEYTGMTDLSQIVIYTPDGSAAAVWADEKGVKHNAVYEPVLYTVSFYDDADHILEIDHFIADVLVEDGYDGANAYKMAGLDLPTKEGYVFDSWWPDVSKVTHDMETGARYTEIDTTITITFWDRDWDDTEGVSYVKLREDGPLPYGSSVTIPQTPSHEGYTFIGWLNGKVDENKPGYFGPFTQDTDIYAQYERGGSGGTGDDGNGGNGSGGTGDDGNGGNGSGGVGGNGSGGTGTGGDGTFYTLTVVNGSGSGSYVAGSQPFIVANDPSSTQEFSHWTIEPDDTAIASKNFAVTVITMPEENVTVTAHYQAKTGSSTGSGNSSSANSSRPNNGSGTVGGTTVVIDKNGLSNTGVVSATVNGSSDNFVIKITESSEATEAVIRALMAEYGSLDNIKYFPMDISLYDSTGTRKITDTTGLSVSITLPLPDSLITYAGNNKVAGVVNDRLDKLTPKFTTIQGVSCVTFTAEHFSPYVIYVDTANLTAGTYSDSTPKTGDGIHPKWFLSIGLACLSFVMFMQKDRKKPQKVKVKAKA